MALFNLRTGGRYRALITLGILERLASNDAVANKFYDAGFVSVNVTGDGKYRWAVGVWSGAAMSVNLPSQVSRVEELP